MFVFLQIVRLLIIGPDFLQVKRNGFSMLLLVPKQLYISSQSILTKQVIDLNSLTYNINAKNLLIVDKTLSILKPEQQDYLSTYSQSIVASKRFNIAHFLFVMYWEFYFQLHVHFTCNSIKISFLSYGIIFTETDQLA